VSAQVQSLGTFRALAHAAGVSPTMADWRAIIEVDLVGTALVLEALRPLVRPGAAAVCFASMASQLVIPTADPAIDFLIDAPLDPTCSTSSCNRSHRSKTPPLPTPGPSAGSSDSPAAKR
jgi:NAD(P)-dependent dehydrogenase (short-subunit alcohol dehydrogenase family)